MLTSFSLTQLILISVAYLSTLFGIAWITERGYVPRRWYATRWSTPCRWASTPVPGRSTAR